MNGPLETLMLALAEARPLAVDRILVLGAQAHPGWREWPHVSAWQRSKQLADAWDLTGLPREDDLPQGLWPVVALLPGKAKEEILHGFALARDRVAEGGVIITALPNTAGAGRFEKEFARAVVTVHSLSKHKCRAFWAICNGAWNESCFDRWRALGEPVRVPGASLVTLPGVFSDGRIDEGSRYLADNLPRNIRGRVADLGAGWGYLSDHVLRTSPQVEQMDLYEADARALHCARMNLRAYTAKAAFLWHDVALGISQAYDAIIMNPPFHTGQDRDVSLGLAFLSSAAHALRPGGRLFVVANRQLPYEKPLDALGLRWRVAGENHAYKLLFGEKQG